MVGLARGLAGETDDDSVIIIAVVVIRLLLSRQGDWPPPRLGPNPRRGMWGAPQDGGGGNDQSLGNTCGPGLLPFAEPSPRPLPGLGNTSGRRWRVPKALGPPCPRGTPGPVFREGRILGPEPRTRPIGCPAPPLLPGLSPALCPEQRVAEICLPGRLFTPSAWKASQRSPPPLPPHHPRPSLPGDPGGKKS